MRERSLNWLWHLAQGALVPPWLVVVGVMVVVVLVIGPGCQSITCDNGSTCEFSELTQDRGRQTTDVAREAKADVGVVP